MIELPQYINGYDIKYRDFLTNDILIEADDLLAKVNALLTLFGRFPAVNSGWRPPPVNASISNAARKSNHMTGNAIDLDDDDGLLRDWCMDNLDVLEDLGLWMEHPSATKGWCHLQNKPPRSGRRVFYP